MSLRGCGDTIPRGLGSWCACFGLSVGVLLAVSSHQSPCVLLGKALMMCQGSCCSLRAWLSSVGSRSHRPGLQPAAAARSSARGERGTDSTKEWLCCLVYWMFWCFSTTAPVTVTPEWLRSSSECRDERRISKWPGTPCSQWKSSDVNPLLGFLEEKQRQRRYTWCISDVLMEKKIISNCKVEGICAECSGALLAPSLLSVLVSLQISPSPGFLPGSTELCLSAICLSAEGCFCQFYTRSFSLSKLRWLQTPTDFVGFFFFPPGMHASKNEWESFQRWAL